ncbi:MAG: hypothetical protein DRN66_02155 [Candidatus Nanohalarchaeota archaeon]|nr:MAG: hypothetical protein DRN66_02155 [Candidatus Nanohaloarchaeota archaeon]
MKTILAKYGELWLKSEGVRRAFIKKLRTNTEELLKSQNIKCNSSFLRTCILFRFEEQYSQKISKCIANIAGIRNFCFVEETVLDKDFNSIKERVKKIAQKEMGKKQTFAVRAKRQGKHNFKSRDVEVQIGALISETFGNKVNLTKPGKTFFIEIMDKIAFIYTRRYKGMDGLPAGIEGKIIALIRNDRHMDDDIKAAICMIKRGGEIHPIVLGKASTNDELKYALDALKIYDANIEKRAGKIKCSGLKASLFREELKNSIDTSKAKAICIGIKPEDAEAFFLSAKLFSNRYIAIEHMPLFMPLMGEELINF